PLRLSVDVERPGRRVQLLTASLFAPDGTEVMRSRALKVARAGVDAGERSGGPVDWESASPAEFPFGGPKLVRFPGDGIELRFAEGEFTAPGKSRVWFRLRVPVVAGEQPSGYQRLSAAADFPNGVATPLPWDGYVFINPDLSIHIDREPVGDWICMDATMRVSKDGVGQSEGLLYDTRGRVGRSLQSLYVAPRST
ncbi:MAG: thioesterase family protein, partial [Solirubrobacterales bacterium]|nr:thioesterase family protein [Solirubrobacterales bacterium]